MRLILIIVILALLFGILGFAMTNLETRVAITFWQTTYQDVPLWSVAFLSVVIGIVSVGIIAVVDGAFIRVRLQQLVRENRRLETELNWLRTQPAAIRHEPDALTAPHPGAEDEPMERGLERAAAAPASAPVYQPDDNGEDESDDPYTGGRAV
jgi:hypothetical protein